MSAMAGQGIPAGIAIESAKLRLCHASLVLLLLVEVIVVIRADWRTIHHLSCVIQSLHQVLESLIVKASKASQYESRVGVLQTVHESRQFSH